MPIFLKSVRTAAVRIYALFVALSCAFISVVVITFASFIPPFKRYISHAPSSSFNEHNYNFSSSQSLQRRTGTRRKLIHSASRRAFARLSALPTTRALRRKHHVSLSVTIPLPPQLSAFRRRSRLLFCASQYHQDAISSSPLTSRSPSPLPTRTSSDLYSSSTCSTSGQEDYNCFESPSSSPSSSSTRLSIKPPRFRKLSSTFKLRRVATLAAAKGQAKATSKISLVKSFASSTSSFSKQRRATLPAPLNVTSSPPKWKKVNAVMSAVESSLPFYLARPENPVPNTITTRPASPLRTPPMDRHATMDSFTWGLIDHSHL